MCARPCDPQRHKGKLQLTALNETTVTLRTSTFAETKQLHCTLCLLSTRKVAKPQNAHVRVHISSRVQLIISASSMLKFPQHTFSQCATFSLHYVIAKAVARTITEESLDFSLYSNIRPPCIYIGRLCVYGARLTIYLAVGQSRSSEWVFHCCRHGEKLDNKTASTYCSLFHQ